MSAISSDISFSPSTLNLGGGPSSFLFIWLSQALGAHDATSGVIASRYVLIFAMPVLHSYTYFFLNRQGNFSIIIMDTHPSCKPAIPDTTRAVQAERKEIHFRLPSAAPLHCPTVSPPVLPPALSVLPRWSL